MRRLPKILWVILAAFAFVNGLEALRYLLPHLPFPAEIDNFIHRRIPLSLHALGGAIALMTGPLQFLPGFRESNWHRHRLLGWIYCGAVLLGCCASVCIAPHAQTGWTAAWGFLTLGAAWMVTTGLAIRFILRGDALQHRRWMIRSYALTAAAITLRIYLPLVFVFHYSERDRGGVVPAFCADAFGDKCAGQAGVPAKGVEFSTRCEAVRSG